MEKVKSARGVALVLTLSMLVLITILVVGLSTILTTERSTSRSALEHQKAVTIAEIARDHAVAVLRDSIEGGRSSGKIWSSQPGKITIFNSDGTVDTASSRDLSTGSDSTQPEVDLNQAMFGGDNPIASASSVNAATAPVMSVNWVNILSDPTSAASGNNPLVGRYAFWVDDESSKLNINTADGTSKNVDPDWSASPSTVPVSYGSGVPTEVSLQALKGITSLLAQNISSVTGVRPGSSSARFFNNAREIQQSSIPATAYQDNNFDLTSFSRSPELNIFGEPKIYLMTAGATHPLVNTPLPVLNVSAGVYGGVSTGTLTGVPLREVYPSSNPFTVYYDRTSMTSTGVGNQLPVFKVNSSISASTNVAPNSPLPQYFYWDTPQTIQSMNPPPPSPPSTNPTDPPDINYNMGLRIAQYLKGYNSQGNAITWPTFPGTTTNGFEGKYTDRQIDSIALQILDLMDKDAEADASASWALPSLMGRGFLSNLPVKGLSRGPHIDQVLMQFEVTAGNPPKISCNTQIQWYWPKEYKGYPGALASNAFYGGHFDSVHASGYNWSFLNVQDAPLWTFTDWVGNNQDFNITHAAPLGGYWQNNMMTITAQDGQSAGIDQFGNDPSKPDPDQASAQAYHPNRLNTATFPDGTPNPNYNPAYPATVYMGSGTLPHSIAPMLSAGWFMPVYANPDVWNPGDYHGSQGGGLTVLFDTRQLSDPLLPPPSPPQPFTQPVNQLTIKGGIAIWSNTFFYGQLDAVPLDSVRGAVSGEATWDGSGWNITDPNVRAAILASIISLPTQGITLNVPTSGQLSTTATVLWKVADPLVNNFPGDWKCTVYPNNSSPSPSDYTVKDPTYTDGYASVYPNGAVNEFQAAGGGDPSSYWVPEANQNIPKSARFPSVGYLQYVRTGLMPDKQYAAVDPTASGAAQAAAEAGAQGTPFRLLNLSPSTSPTQATLGGLSYPDWALLDLFTVPVTPQAFGASQPLEMTYGGSTPGRVNVNSPLTLAPFSSVSRSTPLAAVFQGLQVSNSYGPNSLGAGTDGWAETPSMTTIAPTDAQTLAGHISSYVSRLGRPLMMPAEIANVPEVAAYLYTPSNLPSGTQSYVSRNDLLRQALGNLTTQSNTFSIWAVGQTIKKKPGNTNYSNFENGDIIMGEARTHYIVERYIDTGTDGIPGNANSPGVDGVIGTPDDPIDGDYTATPSVSGANPKMTYPLPYKYRVMTAEEIVN